MAEGEGLGGTECLFSCPKTLEWRTGFYPDSMMPTCMGVEDAKIPPHAGYKHVQTRGREEVSDPEAAPLTKQN